MKLGKQNAKAVDCTLAESGQNKTPCVAVEFQNEEGESCTWYGYLTDKAAERTIRDLRKMGWNGDDISELSAGMLPNSIEIDVYEEEYEGTMREKVRIAGMAAKPIEQSGAKALAAKLKGLCKTVPKAGTGEKPPF